MHTYIHAHKIKTYTHLASKDDLTYIVGVEAEAFQRVR